MRFSNHKLGTGTPTLSHSHDIKELRILGEGLGVEIGSAVAYEMNSQVLMPLHARCQTFDCANRTIKSLTSGTHVSHYPPTAKGLGH